MGKFPHLYFYSLLLIKILKKLFGVYNNISLKLNIYLYKITYRKNFKNGLDFNQKGT